MTRAALLRDLLLAPLLQFKGRALLSVAAIALGVALGYAVQLINAVAIGEFTHAVQTLSGTADLVVSGPRAGFDEMLYPRVAAMAEVAVASPVLEVDAKVAGRREVLRILGIDIFRAALVQPELAASESGERLDYLRADRIFLTSAAAERLALKTGDTLQVQVGLNAMPLKVAGILKGAALRQRLGVVDIGGMQSSFGRPGVINRLDIRLRAGVDPAAFARRLEPTLPAGLHLESPQAEVERGANLSRAYRINLNVLALVALFTGGLLVFSTQALAVVRRRAQIALLRVLGFTRSRVLALLLTEALAVGLLGALVGIFLGHLIAEVMLRYFGADLGAGHFRGLRPELQVEPLGIVVFGALGIATALAGSLAPALEAARAQPAQALKAGDEQGVFASLQPAWPGMLLLAAGALLTQAPPLDGLPVFGYLAIALLLVGTIMLMPRIALATLSALPLPRMPSGRLALAQLRGAPGQAVVSLAAIVAAVSLMVSMAIMVSSFRQSLDEWLGLLLPANLYLRTGMLNESAFISREDQERLARIPGVSRVETLRIQQLLLSPERPRIMLLARSVDRAHPLERLPLAGKFLVPRPGEPPPAYISETIADVYGYRLGETILLPIAATNAAFTVAGIWRDYARLQGAVVIEREVYIRLTGDDRANDVALWLAAGATPAAVRERVREQIPGDENLEMIEPGEIREISLHVFDRTFAVTYALEAVAVIIGLFGLSSAFGALVLARRREFGMLRHIGMTRRQIGAMLAVEGALVSSLGLAAGLVLGWIISLVLIEVVNRQSFHWSMELHLPWGALAVFTLIMLALATLTALASGARAMGADVVQAVKEDW